MALRRDIENLRERLKTIAKGNGLILFAGALIVLLIALLAAGAFLLRPRPPTAASLDGQGDRVLERLEATYRSFVESRTRAIPSSDHICTACPRVANLDLKVVIHRGPAVRQSVGSGSDLLGPAVTVAHRLLKNTVRDRIGRASCRERVYGTV